MKATLTRSLVLSGTLLVTWGARAQAGEGPLAVGRTERRAVPSREVVPPTLPACVLGNDFETGTVEGWTSSFVNPFSVHQPGSASQNCLYGHDAPGGSTINAPPSYQGDWIKKLTARHCSCGVFCFDVNLVNDGRVGSSPSFPASFVLWGPGNTYAEFQSNLLINEHSGWNTFCAEIRPNGATPPATAGGSWSLHGTSPTPNWDSIVQNVTKVTVPVDFHNDLPTEEVEYDNFCLRCASEAKPDFQVDTLCAGQSTHFTSTSTGAATWAWSYNGQTFSTQPNATFTFPVPGTYPVQLCVNPACGGASACAQHLVTIIAGPAPFTVTGPVLASSNSANYCVTPAQTGATYSWSVTNPATVAPASGACTTVTWNGINGGLVTATATVAAGRTKCSLSAELTVEPDPSRDLECCRSTTLAVTGARLIPIGSSGDYQLQANLSASPGPFTRVTAEILSTIAIYPTSSRCGQSGPAESHVLSALGLGSLAAALPVPGSREVWWQGPPTALSNTPATIDLQLPSFGGTCPPDGLTVCMKYSFSSTDCKTCQHVECYDVPCPGCEVTRRQQTRRLATPGGGQ